MERLAAGGRVRASKLAVARPNTAKAQAITLVSAAATIGVVVPPSLVLILVGDAMLRAHTEASKLPGYALSTQRIVNTQDVLHAALLPSLAVLLLWAALVWIEGRTRGDAASEPVAPRQWAMGATAVAVILMPLAGVFTGRLFAVEAAAAGGCLMAVAALASRSARNRDCHA